MTTILDIIDTAVKIGLGASIAGVASFMLAKRNNNHEERKMHKQDRKNITKEIAMKLEKVESITNEVVYFFHIQEFGSAKKALIPASEEINSAVALSNILGQDELVTAVRNMSILVDGMYRELTKDSPDENSLIEIQKQFDANKKLAYPHIRELYSVQ